MSVDTDTRNAERAATEILVELGVRPPIDTYELLHAIVAAAWLKGSAAGIVECRDMIGDTFPDALSDPSDAEVRL